MGFVDIHNNIRGKFKTEVIDVSSTIGDDDVAWDNVVFDGHDASNTAVWVRFQVLTGESQSRELGSATARTSGVALASVFALVGGGDNLSLELVDEIVSAFRQSTNVASGTTVKFHTPSVQHIGRDGSWWQTNVTIPFTTDDA